MTRIFFFCLCGILLFSCKKEEINYSKGFIKYLGGIESEEAYDVQQTSDGGFILIGTTNSFGYGGTDMYVVKTDSKGNQEWFRTYGDSLNDIGASVQQTLDGGYIFFGTFTDTSTNERDMYLVRANASGDTLWTRRYGYMGFDDYGISARQTSDGGFIIAGNTEASQDGDVRVIKLNAAGVQLSAATYPAPGQGAGLDEVVNILQTSDGGFIFTTNANGLSTPRVVFLPSNLVSGAIAAPTRIEFSEPTMRVSGEVDIVSANEYVLTGRTTNDDVFLLKFQNLDSKVWFKTFGGSGGDIGSSVKYVAPGDGEDGGYIILGSTNSEGAGARDIYLIKTDLNGNSVWTKTFGGPGLDAGKVVKRTSDGGYIIVGTVEFGDDPSAKDNIICLIKVDKDGNIGN